MCDAVLPRPMQSDKRLGFAQPVLGTSSECLHRSAKCDKNARHFFATRIPRRSCSLLFLRTLAIFLEAMCLCLHNARSGVSENTSLTMALGTNRDPANPVPRYHRRRLLALCVLVAVIGLNGCLGPVAKAPFSRRVGSGQPGSLIGPFDGQVLDQSTGSPISSVLVIGTWTFQENNSLSVPESSHTATAITSSDGTYALPSLPSGRQFAGLLRRFTLVAYKAGFVGYRSDLHFSDRLVRRDFVQHGNVIRLDRFPQNESHVRHLVFLGQSAELRSVCQTETVAAARELGQSAPSLSPSPSLSTDPLAVEAGKTTEPTKDPSSDGPKNKESPQDAAP